MTIIVPIITEEGGVFAMLFVDDIDYLQQEENETVIFYKGQYEFLTSLSLREIQKKIESASMKIFKFN
jgi:DNA-binding LytR/AlgR family response regulator